MDKSGLRTGMAVQDRAGYCGVVLKGTVSVDGIKWFRDKYENQYEKWQELSNYGNDLLVLKENSESEDIVKVYQPSNFDYYTSIKVIDEEYLIWDRMCDIEKIDNSIELPKTVFVHKLNEIIDKVNDLTSFIRDKQ